MRTWMLLVAVVAGAQGACTRALPGGETTGSGGTTAGSVPGGGGTTGGAGGTVGGGGASGSGRGGSTDTAGTSGTGSFGTPSCTGLVTAGGGEPGHGVPCVPSDPQLCYKTCGPEKIGVKSVTCFLNGSDNGVYQEMSGCTFDPARDHSCYRIPSTANVACPAGVTPQASLPCDAPTCTACNNTGGLDGGQYLDSTGAAKTGFCVCQAPNAAGTRTWSCASNNGSWPCPLANGCGVGGTGGTVGGGGTSGSGRGGSTGGAGTSGTGSFGTPSCTGLVTAGFGEEPNPGVACGASDPQLCYRTCGPEKVGVRSETCTTAGTYQQMSGCTFDPARDHSCYRIPSTANVACPVGVTPQASLPCDVPTCTVCNSTGGLDGGQYVDSTGAAKTGFCVCQAPNAAGTRTWSCATNNGSWPCPLANGC